MTRARLIALSLLGIAIMAIPFGCAQRHLGPILVKDGDSVMWAGVEYRLIGYDTPETVTARCASERALGQKATRRLEELLGKKHELRPVPCNCRPGTEGTKRCNRGRLCAVLLIEGEDVAAILISEGLAREYVCGATSCPRRQGWCS
jgi:endonuclease YncB( thermonuclease family)